MPDRKMIIDGAEYPFPTPLTMGEQRTIAKYTGKNLPGPDDPDEPGYDPNFLAGLVHVVFVRANPSLPPARIEAMVDKVIEVRLEGFEAEDGQSPPAPTPSVSDSPNGTSGPSSGNGLGSSPETNQPATGTPHLAP